MFDNVGRNERQAKRQAGAFLASILINGSAFIGLVWAGSRVVEVVKQEEETLVVVELAAPPPPPPPPPAGGGGKKKEKKEKKEEEIKPREDVPVDPVPLPEEVPEPAAEPDEPEGDPNGVKDGVADGVKDGVVDGVKDGVLGGDLNSKVVRTVHWSELVVKTRASIRPEDYPEAAAALNLPETRCVVRLTIDEKGIPETVTPKNCPDIFHDAAVKIGKRYRFYPFKVEGRATSVGFDLALNFKPA